VRPLFTIHAGEFLAADYIERKFRNVNVWVPAKDTGIDLLVTDKKRRKTVSLQVKFSRDFLATHMPPAFQKPLRACGWWKFDREKLKHSTANYWAFVLAGVASHSTDFVIITPAELLRRLNAMHHGKLPKTVQNYFWVTEKNMCWETRALVRKEHRLIAEGQFINKARNFSTFLNNWGPIKSLNR
jgi:hypothetical protein